MIGITFFFQVVSLPLSAWSAVNVVTEAQPPRKHVVSLVQQSPNTVTTAVPAAPPTTSPPKNYRRTKLFDRRATIVVQLSGEMANNLHHIAHGVSLQLMALEEFGIDCNLVLRHHEGPNNRAPRPKWKSARDHIQQCFPNLTSWNFGEGNNNIFLERQNLQKVWLEGRADHLFGLVNSQNISEIRRGLTFLSDEVLTDDDRPWVDKATSAIRIPFLYLETLDVFPLIDHYFDQLRDLLVFNDTACCAKVPEPSDSVFHFRNYQSEMPERRAYEMGFSELSPRQVATEVFAQMQPGERVKITTRTFNQKARNYAEALQGRAINASVVTDQSDVQDFCFLKQAKKALVGSARSTFVMWAALLGDASTVRLYHVDNRGLRDRHPNFWERFTHNFTHPRLRDRLSFELYRTDT